MFMDTEQPLGRVNERELIGMLILIQNKVEVVKKDILEKIHKLSHNLL